MNNRAEPQNSARRSPQQARAVVTREAIFEASIQILEGEGEGAFNTNRIAQKAGVSVGTLYQYFSCKEDILLELAWEETRKLRKHNAALMKEELSPMEIARSSIRFYISMMKDHPATRRAALKAVKDAASASDMGKSSDNTAALLPRRIGRSKTENFIISRAVMGVVQAAVLENYKGLYGKAFEDGLVKLVEGFHKS